MKTTTSSPPLLELQSQQIRYRQNGIEFRSEAGLPIWAEKEVKIISPEEGPRTFHGVIIACQGNRRSGYLISMIFISLSREVQQWLATKASG